MCDTGRRFIHRHGILIYLYAWTLSYAHGSVKFELIEKKRNLMLSYEIREAWWRLTAKQCPCKHAVIFTGHTRILALARYI